MPRIEIYVKGLSIPVVAEVSRYRVSRATQTSDIVAFEYDSPLGLNPRLAYIDPKKVLAVVELDSVAGVDSSQEPDEEIPHIHEVAEEPRQAELVEAVPIAAPTELPTDEGPGLAEG